MRAKYCCDSKAYERYYLNQVGNGTFSGPRYQQGYGLGNIFSSLAKSVVPLMKSGAKAIGKQVLQSGVGFASDVMSGKNVRQAAVDRAKAAGKQLVNQARSKVLGELRQSRKRKRSQRVQKAKRKRHKDIFS